MSIIENAERYMKRYDYLISKRERRYSHGKRLTQAEDEELVKLRPNVFTPILVMFELLHDTVHSNQTIRKETNHHKRARAQKQSGGAGSSNPSANAIAIAAVSAASAGGVPPPSTLKTEGDKGDSKEKGDGEGDDDDEDDDADAKEAQRLSELEESLMPLLTKIIVFIEQNKNKEKKEEEEEEEEKYPDIGTSAKNSAILVIRRIKKWWNDLIAGGSSDLSSKINLKKAIPQLPNNQDDANKIIEKATAIVDEPLKKIEKLLSNDVRDIASSSVEGIMNALSLIPGIGTTLQLWRLLQNVIVIMSKSVTTMAGAKTEGVALKEGIQEVKGDLEAAGKGAAQDAAKGAIPDANGALPKKPDVPKASVPGGGGAAAATAGAGAGGGGGGDGGGAGAGGGGGGDGGGGGGDGGGAGDGGGGDGGGGGGAGGGGGGAGDGGGGGGGGGGDGGGGGGDGGGGGGDDGAGAGAGAGGGGDGAGVKQAGGGGRKSNHIRSIKKYKREYKQSLRDIRKTRKKMMKFMRNII